MSMRKIVSSDEIFEDLCEKIIELKYMPGDKISENDLSTQYGVSRHVVRSAITRLKERRLVEVYPQRGTFVSLMDMKYIETVLYVREAVEHEAVSRLHKLTDDQLEALVQAMRKNLVSQLMGIQEGIETKDFYVIDTEFHRLFMEAAGHGDAINLVRDHFAHVKRWRNFEIRSTEHLMELYREHLGIANRMEQRDWQGVNEALHDHLNTVERHKHLFTDISPEYFIVK